jgi:hypothetical protein
MAVIRKTDCLWFNFSEAELIAIESNLRHVWTRVRISFTTSGGGGPEVPSQRGHFSKDTDVFVDNAEKFGTCCTKNPTVSIVNAAEAILGK